MKNLLLLICLCMFGCAYSKAPKEVSVAESQCLYDEAHVIQAEVNDLNNQCREDISFVFDKNYQLVWDRISSRYYQKHFMQSVCMINVQNSVLWNLEHFSECNQKFYKNFMALLQVNYPKVNWTQMQLYADAHPEIYNSGKTFEKVVMKFHVESVVKDCENKKKALFAMFSMTCDQEVDLFFNLKNLPTSAN